MTTIAEVINNLAARGVTLEPVGHDGLLVNGIGKITADEKEMLKANKAIILKVLLSQDGDSNSVDQSPSYRLESLDGLPLLSGDRKFIRQRLRLLPAVHHEKSLKTYRFKFLEGVELEQAEHRKDNAGRYRANTWLLEVTYNRENNPISK